MWWQIKTLTFTLRHNLHLHYRPHNGLNNCDINPKGGNSVVVPGETHDRVETLVQKMRMSQWHKLCTGVVFNETFSLGYTHWHVTWAKYDHIINMYRVCTYAAYETHFNNTWVKYTVYEIPSLIREAVLWLFDKFTAYKNICKRSMYICVGCWKVFYFESF